MREGEIVLAVLPQADREQKYRPTLILRRMPNGDFLVCAVSTQINKYIPEFDEIIRPSDDNFTQTGLKKESLVRLSFMAVIPPDRLGRTIGCVSNLVYQRLLFNLSNYLVAARETND